MAYGRSDPDISYIGGDHGIKSYYILFKIDGNGNGDRRDHPGNKWGYSLAERPKDYKYPVLWLLCGGGFDYTDWQRYTAIELYAAQAGIAVVMPSAYYSGYMDTIHGDYKYFL